MRGERLLAGLGRSRDYSDGAARTAGAADADATATIACNHIAATSEQQGNNKPTTAQLARNNTGQFSTTLQQRAFFLLLVFFFSPFLSPIRDRLLFLFLFCPERAKSHAILLPYFFKIFLFHFFFRIQNDWILNSFKNRRNFRVIVSFDCSSPPDLEDSVSIISIRFLDSVRAVWRIRHIFDAPVINVRSVDYRQFSLQARYHWDWKWKIRNCC